MCRAPPERHSERRDLDAASDEVGCVLEDGDVAVVYERDGADSTAPEVDRSDAAHASSSRSSPHVHGSLSAEGVASAGDSAQPAGAVYLVASGSRSGSVSARATSSSSASSSPSARSSRIKLVIVAGRPLSIRCTVGKAIPASSPSSDWVRLRSNRVRASRLPSSARPLSLSCRQSHSRIFVMC